MRVWAKTEEFREGKFLVTRRDGTTPDWPHFVMGARDPCVPYALQAYAAEAERRGLDQAFCDSVLELGDDFEAFAKRAGHGDPDAAPHRKDLPLAIAMMRGVFSVADVAAALEKIAEFGLTGKGEKAAAIAGELLLGRKPNVIDKQEEQ